MYLSIGGAARLARLLAPGALDVLTVEVGVVY